MSSAMLEISNLSKTFAQPVLKNLHLEIQPGTIHGLVGQNGAGKSTLSEALKKQIDGFVGDSKKVFILDGDVIRTGLNKDLGFSAEARAENIRRIAEVAKLFCLAGQIVFVAFISPYGAGRDLAR